TADGAVDHSGTVVNAFRADGSHVRASSFAGVDGTIQETRSIIDLGAGKKSVVASSTRSVTTYFYTEEQISALRTASHNTVCPAEGRPDERQVMGLQVIKEVAELPGRDGDIVASAQS